MGYYLKCSFDDSLSYYNAKRGRNCLDWFVKELETILNRLTTIFDENIPINMNVEDVENFIRATKCHICEKEFIRNVDIIVKDHCHFTGKFRGAAHQACNLAYRDYRTVPVVFHNLTHYDSHFLVEKIRAERVVHFRLTPNKFYSKKDMDSFKKKKNTGLRVIRSSVDLTELF